MEDEIDWTMPLEAYHPSGRVEAVKLDPKEAQPDDEGDYCLEQYVGGALYFNAEGEPTFGVGDVRIRNRTTKTDPDTARAVQSLPTEYEMRRDAVALADGDVSLAADILAWLKGEKA